MEFCKKCCFCIDLRKGVLAMGIEIMILCAVNNGFSIFHIVYGIDVPAFVYMLLIVDTVVFICDFLIWNRVQKERYYAWYISLYMFIIVLCQIIETLIMLILISSTQFYMYELATSIAISGFLCYYMMMALSYCYSISEEERFDTVQVKLTSSQSSEAF